MQPNLKIDWNTDLYGAVSAEEYDQLVSEIPHTTVFNSWSWISSCYDHLVELEESWVLTVRDENGRLIACLPMVVITEQKFILTSRTLRLLGYPFTDRCTLLVNKSVAGAFEVVLDALFYNKPFNWHRMEWNELFLPQDQIDRISQWAANKNRVNDFKLTSNCPVLPLESKSREELEASYTSKLRSDLKRRKKKLLEHGDVEILHYQPTETEVDELLDQLKHVEDSSWKGAEGIGIFSHTKAFKFFKEVSRKLAKYRQLDIAEIRIDGNLVSYKYGFRYNSVFLDYNIAYLPEYHRLGLGRLLLNEVILSSSEKNYKAVDASRVGAKSKHLLFERSQETIPHFRWSWYGDSLKGRYYHFMLHTVKPWAKQMKVLLEKHWAGGK